MKKSIAIIGLVLTASTFAMTTVSAKRAKWYCVALDPATPWIQTCYSTTSRP